MVLLSPGTDNNVAGDWDFHHTFRLLAFLMVVHKRLSMVEDLEILM